MQVIAACYDNPIPGYGTNTVGNLRLWEAKPVTEFDLEEFNERHYTEVWANSSTPLTRISLICIFASWLGHLLLGCHTGYAL